MKPELEATQRLEAEPIDTRTLEAALASAKPSPAGALSFVD